MWWEWSGEFLDLPDRVCLHHEHICLVACLEALPHEVQTAGELGQAGPHCFDVYHLKHFDFDDAEELRLAVPDFSAGWH